MNTLYEQQKGYNVYEQRNKISSNVLCATSKGSDQPVQAQYLTSCLDKVLICGVIQHITLNSISSFESSVHVDPDQLASNTHLFKIYIMN